MLTLVDKTIKQVLKPKFQMWLRWNWAFKWIKIQLIREAVMEMRNSIVYAQFDGLTKTKRDVSMEVAKSDE